MALSAPLIISVSGVRGIIGQSLTPDVATRFGQAFGAFLKTQSGKGSAENRPSVAVGSDTRPSGPMVFGAFAAGLLSVGVNVIDVGVATTPSVALLGRFLKTAASVVITASHNPIMWNGIKFLRHDGIAYPPPQAAQIKQTYQDPKWELTSIEQLGRLTTDSRAHAHHIQTVLQLFDARGIAEKRYKVVLDSVNGAGSIATPMLLGKLGVELVHINAEATGEFAHPPEPTRENLTALAEEVKKRRAVIGFAQDPDADRLAIVDENGVYIGEEYTLALAAYARLLAKKDGTKPLPPLVANLSTSRMIDDLAQRFGTTVLRTPVGEANVASAMLEHNAILGGEGNGGVIDLRVGPVRDSFLGIAMLLDLLTRTGKTVSQLVSEIPRYAMIKTKFECTPEEAKSLVDRVRMKFGDQKLDTQDGVRIDWPEGWVHVRPSNTEPIARVIAEAKDEAVAERLIAQVDILR